MPGGLLNLQSTVMCPHGGTAILSSSNTQTSAENGCVLTMADIVPIAGCPVPFSPGTAPCILIIWAEGSSSAMINGIPALNASSIGICMSANGAPAGSAVIGATQPEDSAE